MIYEEIGNVLDIKEGIIVHGCNAQGVMGSGIALEIKNRFPGAYELYKEQEREQGLIPGEVSKYTVLPYTKYIVNAITQPNYGVGKRQVSYDALELCFKEVVGVAKQISLDSLAEANARHAKIFPALNHLAPDVATACAKQLTSFPLLEIHFPLIGAGLGGGNWEIIRTIIDQTLPDAEFKKVLWRLN